MKKIAYLFSLLLFAAGLGILLFPMVEGKLSQWEGQKKIRQFQEKAEKISIEDARLEENRESESVKEREKAQDSAKQTSSGQAEQGLLEEMRAYNQKIYAEKQKGLCDAWSYRENIFDFSAWGLDGDLIGSLTIDAMGIQLPLFIGANEENMKTGAAVLSQTSMPIGGENTNCVIAAHRGYGTAAMFRDIEALSPGDIVKVENFWDTLYYQVVKCIAIVPDDIEAVKILEGQDMLTLITCHPYTHNYQRYVVYCQRTDPPGGTSAGEKEEEKEKEALKPEEIPYEGVPYHSSKAAIKREQALNTGAAVAVIFAGWLLLFWFRKRRKQ